MKWFCLKCGDVNAYHNDVTFVCSKCHNSAELYYYIPLKEKIRDGIESLLFWKHFPEIEESNGWVPYPKRKLKQMRKEYLKNHISIDIKKSPLSHKHIKRS